MVSAAKSEKRRKTVPAESQSSEPSREARWINERLADFGFMVPVPLIDQWDAETRIAVSAAIRGWDQDMGRAVNGDQFPDSDRIPVPAVLRSFDEPTQEQLHEAVTEGHVTSAADPGGVNPYPLGTKLAEAWQKGFSQDGGKAGTAPAAETAEAPETQPAPATSNASDAAELATKRDAERKADLARQQQLAIEAAQDDLEEAAAHQAELEDEVRELKSELKEKKSAFDNAGERVRKASRALAKARNGVFERMLPFGREKPAELDVPDQDVGGAAVAAAPARDEGAFVSLDNLVKGTLQEYIPGTPEEAGISEKQCESLKKIVGETIGALEKWQKENGGGEWWRKALKDKGVGLGGAACDKLVEAQEAIRRKYPIPDPTEPATAEASVVVTMTDSEAVKRLQALMSRCESIAETCEADGGVAFLESVGSDAGKMRVNILKHGSCTQEQARAILNWESGVEQWASNSDDVSDDFADGLDEDDSLDVPDEDGDDE